MNQPDKKGLIRRIDVAAGRAPADLIIKNGKIVDVFNADIIEGDVAIAQGTIVGIGRFDMPGRQIIDAEGRYICPAFIDGHVHIESALVTPQEFAKALLPHGVTTIVTDPHEIANVAGIPGIQFMLDSTENLPFDAYFMLPSCVPATPFEHAGAILKADDLRPLLVHPRVLGLAEVMDFPSVKAAEESMIDKLLAATQHRIDGHAAGVNSNGINIYMTAGIRTDHECVTAEEAQTRLQRGMYVMIREGSVAKNAKALLPAVTVRNSRRFLFVTDDKHLDDLIKEGSIDHIVRLAIKEGLSPLTAIQMGTLNPAECFGLNHKGAIAPGYDADFLLLDDLENITIHQVYKNGGLIAEQGKLAETHFSPPPPVPANIKNSVHLPPLETTHLRIPLKGNRAHVIEIIPNNLVTNHLIEEVERDTDGAFTPSNDNIKIAVIERHRASGHIGLGIVKGLGLRKGAIASTVAHDSHNLIVAGTNDEDMIFAATELAKIQGGLLIACEGVVVASLPLPIAGLLSDQKGDVVLRELAKIKEGLAQVGFSQPFNPFLTLSFLALPVIPELKITDSGLFDVVNFQPIEVEASPTE